MDKLEQYLDQVCRGIAGPRSMRQHVRQELREHLLDAVAAYQAAGLQEAAALDKALEEFGKPQEVRSELEATHGHRLMAVVIDKALDWKEKTMKAKWLWTTWAHLTLGVVILMEVLFITFATIFIVPKFNKLLNDGVLDPAILHDTGSSWMPAFLNDLSYWVGSYTTWLLLLAASAVGLFEWRVKSENKPFIRLSAWGTVAVILMVIVTLASAALVISFCIGVPATGKLARPFAVEQIFKIEESVGAVELALAKKDWEACQDHAKRATEALAQIMKSAPVLHSLASAEGALTLNELRTSATVASENLVEAQQAIRDKDLGKVEAALQKFRMAYGPLRDAAKRPTQ